MVKTATAFLLGCIVCLNLAELPRHGWLLALALPATLWFRQSLLSAFIVGLLWAGLQAQLSLAQRLPEQQAGRDMLITGMIASIPEYHDDVLRFTFQTDDKQLPARIKLSWYHPEASLPGPGERWKLWVRLKPPAG